MCTASGDLYMFIDYLLFTYLNHTTHGVTIFSLLRNWTVKLKVFVGWGIGEICGVQTKDELSASNFYSKVSATMKYFCKLRVKLIIVDSPGSQILNLKVQWPKWNWSGTSGIGHII